MHRRGHVFFRALKLLPAFAATIMFAACERSEQRTISSVHRIESQEDMARISRAVLDEVLVASGFYGLCRAELEEDEETRFRLLAGGIYVEPLLVEIRVGVDGTARVEIEETRSVFPNGNERFEIVRRCKVELDEAGTSRLLEEIDRTGFWEMDESVWESARILHGVDLSLEGYTSDACRYVSWVSSSPKEREWSLLRHLGGITPCGDLVQPVLRQYQSTSPDSATRDLREETRK